jgi:hypothetical protein
VSTNYSVSASNAVTDTESAVSTATSFPAEKHQ